MSGVKFTTEQQSVIDARNCDLLVSAAAGSGKTAVLVERILKRLTEEKEPVSLDRLLVMTFTRAAAEGMRAKISEALTARVRNTEKELEGLQEGTPEYRECEDRRIRLKTQEALLPRARISTIDSICQNLIRQYFQYLDIDPAFRVADEAELRLMRMDLIRDLLEDAYEEGSPDFLRFSTAFTRNGLDEKLSTLILDTWEFAQARPWPEEFLLSCERDAGEEEAGKLWETVWFGNLLEDLRRQTEKNLQLARDLKTDCSAQGGWKPYLEAAVMLEEFYRKLEGALLQEERKNTYVQIRELLQNYQKPELSRKGCKESTPQKKEQAKLQVELLRSWPQELKKNGFSASAEDCLRTAAGSAADLKVLLRLTLDFSRRFAEKKRSKSVVDFSDMEHMALQLLYREEKNIADCLNAEGKEKRGKNLSPGRKAFTPLADELARGLDEILIDEYQDSNEVQEELIRALSGERFGRPDVFMVGDVKQSIYSFRQAKPELFMNKYRSFRKPAEGGTQVRIDLNKNFRSRPEVLDTVNAVFQEVMKPSCGGIGYDGDAVLHPGRTDCLEEATGRIKASPESRTELLLVEDKASDAKETGVSEQTEGPFFAEDELEYVMIAERIQELTGKEKWSKKDITILMRNSKKAEKLVNVLERFGIDACFDSATGFFASTEVGTVLAFLSIIDNPYQDIPLAAVLKSPMASFTDEELARIRIGCEYTEGGRALDFYEALVLTSSSTADTEKQWKLKEKAAAFLNRLREYRKLSGHLPVHELIDRIYRETGYYDMVSALPGGLKRRRNLDRLLEKAENYAAASYHGLFNFIRYTEQLKSYETDYGEAGGLSGSEDVVRITTIHKSKGLEYPVVIIAGMSGRFNMSDSRENLMMDGELGLACDYVDTENRIRYSSLKAAVIRERKKIAQAGEELRILYVAMTRARDKLILTGRVNGYADKLKKERQRAEDIAGCGSQLQILLKSGITETEQVCVHTVEKAVLQRTEPARRNMARENTWKELLEQERTSEEKLYQRKKVLTAMYPHGEETGLAPKVSVSQLKAATLRTTEFEFVQDLEENRQTKGAEYGTTIHRAFEVLDYGKEGDAALPVLPGTDESMMCSVRRVIAAFRKTKLAEEMKQAFLEGKLKREQHFMLGLPASRLTPGSSSEELQLMQGIIDAYIEEEDGIRLIDYKTDRVETEEKLISRYCLQLELYAQALEQLLRKPVREKIIYSTRLEKAIYL